MSEGVDHIENAIPQEDREHAQIEAQPQREHNEARSPSLAPPPIPTRPAKARLSQAELLPPPPGVNLRPAPRRHFPEWSEAIQQNPLPSPIQEPQEPSAQKDEAALREAETSQEALADEQVAPEALLPAQVAAEAPLEQEQEEHEDGEQAELAQVEEQLEEPSPSTPEKEARPEPAIPAQRKARPAFSSQALAAQQDQGSSQGRKIAFAVVGLVLLAGLSWWQLRASPAASESAAEPDPQASADQGAP